ncbi:uncharacterized protein LOC133199799 [Saccostrea echinata]|uniref:uncharacterized protein LOC133199799 n=1 Tax=Saccostrea echinata TaxID=191078 RepID=UPI002A7F95E9|nr:uncharacterized protein LOC133199799 [Saccostrea echinata]
MPKRKRCPVCHEDFPQRSFYRHYASFFDYDTNSWLDHGPEADRTTAREESEKRFKNLLADVAKVTDLTDVEEENCCSDHGDINIPTSCPTDGAAEESDQSSETEDNDDADDDDEPEDWDIPADCLDDDLGIDVQPSPLKTINSLLFCVVYAILYLQAVHHISDNGIEYLLRFLFKIFLIFGTNVNNQLLSEFCIGFPPSLYLARKFLKLDRDDFKRYTVCSSCHTLYEIFDCVFERNGVRYGKQCQTELKVRGKFVKCNTPLVKQVICKGNVRKFYPIKVYYYNSLISGIERVLKRKEIKEVWQHWRDWETETELLRDVYDGRVWKNFMSFNGVPFLSELQNIGLMMNIDWFQPFKNRNNVLNASDFKAALENKMNNVQVIVSLPPIPKPPRVLLKLQNISLLFDFSYDNRSLNAREQYEIGKGKTINYNTAGINFNWVIPEITPKSVFEVTLTSPPMETQTFSTTHMSRTRCNSITG